MKNRIRMIIMALLICVCAFVLAVSLNAADESDSNSNDACVVVEYEDLEEVKDYLAGKNTYPTKEGYLFAGWYTTDDILDKSDAEVLKYAVRNSVPNEGPVYALFVPASVLDVKAQLSGELLEGLDGNEKGSIRFVTTVNSLLYQKVGFEVSYVNSNGAKKSATSSSNKVYDKLYAVGSTTDEYMENGKEYLPTEFSASSKYFKACNLKNIPESDFGVPITVKPFWVTLDGSKVYGETVIKSMDDYFLAENVYVSNSESVTDKADAEGYGTAEKPYATLNYALSKVKNQGTVHVVETYATDANFDWKEHNKTVNITGGTLDFTTLPEVTLKEAVEATAAITATGLDIRDSVTFTDTVLNFTDGHHIYANGNTVEIASDITWGNTSAYVHLYGGAHTEALKSDTNLILKAGQYARVYGGGNYSALTGNVNLTLSGEINSGINYKNSAWTSVLFGGGHAYSKVTGDINITIADETVLFNWIYGGANGPNVTGDIRIDFAGKACGIYGGGYKSTVTGDTYVTMTGGWVEQIFGGCNSKSVTGNTNVDVQDGIVMRRVYGGCYNNTSGSSFATTECVKGHSNVAISPNAEILLESSEDDNSIYSISRGAAPFVDEEGLLIERGAFIFNEGVYKSTYESILGFNDYDWIGFSEVTHHYLIKTNGNTEDGSLGTVSPDGDYIRIKPRRGYSAKIAVEGNTEHYTESETVFKLPELSATTDVKNITVTFETINSNIDKSNYEARIDGAYYESLAKAIEVAPILNSKDTVTVTLLKDIELASQINIESKITIQNEPEKDITIYRGAELATTDMFNVTSTGTLTLAGVEDRNSLVFDGRTQKKEDVESTGSLVKADGNLTLENITIQYAKNTNGNGGAINCEANLTVKNCMFNTCSASGEGGAVYTVNDYKVNISDSTFSENESKDNRGGAICVGTARNTPINISNCTFENNKASSNGGAIRISAKNILNIADSVFEGNNVASGFGGAVAMGSDESTINLSGTIIFDNNKALGTSYGGGAIMTGCVLSIAEHANITIENNETKGLGGGVYFNAKNTPEFILGEGAVLTMSDNKDSVNEDAGTYRNVDIAIKNSGKAAVFNLDGAFDLDGIDTTIGTKITLGVDAQDSDSANITTVMLKASNDINATVQEGDRLVYGSKVADTIFDTEVGDVAYNLDANGYLVGLNPIVELRQENLTRQFASLDIALSEATDGDTIALISDITLDKQLVLNKSVTITTDGEKNRTIYCGTEAAGTAEAPNHVIVIEVPGKKIEFKGFSEESRLIFDGNSNNSVTLTRAFIYPGSSDNVAQAVVMQNVTMQNINSSYGYGSAVCSNAPLDIMNCKFTNCTSTGGGAVYCAADLNVKESMFNKCTSKDGGAIYTKGNYLLEIAESIFTGNKGTGNGGAIFATDSRDEGISINSCSFESNTAGGNGGAIRVSSQNTLNIFDSTFTDNKASTFGGAVAMGTSSSELNLFGKCIFSTNESSSNKYGGGGAIFAPKKLNVKADAWVEMSGNKCSNSIGDAICVQTFVNDSNNGSVEDAIFVIEKDAALYVWDNPSSEDPTIDDICITGGTSLTENENTGFTVSGSYGAWKPVAKIGNVGYKTLAEAVETVDAGEEIQLIADVTLEEQLTIAKSMIISTDGVADRTIYCGAGAANTHVISSSASDIEITFEGKSENSRLIFDGNSNNGVKLANAFVYAGKDNTLAKNVTMQYVTMQNIESTYKYGSAICSNAQVELTNCKFEHCISAGRGAVYCKPSMTVMYSIFTDCTSGETKDVSVGGAIYTEGAINVSNSKFSKCSAYRGGAIYVANNATITDSDFGFVNIANSGNSATNAGGAILVSGANKLSTTNSNFIGNCAGNFGGAIAMSGSTGKVNLSGACEFRYNKSNTSVASLGGGAISTGDKLTIADNANITINNNVAYNSRLGGGVYFQAGNAAQFILGEGATLTMSGNTENSGTEGTTVSRNVDIAIAAGKSAAQFTLKGVFNLTGIDTTPGTLITLGENATCESETPISVYFNGDVTANQLVSGSNIADTIFSAVSDSYYLDADGYLKAK